MNLISFYAIISVFLTSLISLIGALALSVSDKILRRIIFALVSLSAGALFGDAFIHLIPEIFEGASNPASLSIFIILGILFFFILEKFLNWRHSHGVDEESKETEHIHDHTVTVKPLGPIVLVADGIHNFIDGIIIGASYLISVEVGIATTVAVILHEIPQEVGDFGLLIHSGMSKKKALLFNFISSLLAFAGLATALLLGNVLESFISFSLAFAAGGFIYIAGSDLVPELHKTKGVTQSLVQIATMILGIALMYVLIFFE